MKYDIITADKLLTLMLNEGKTNLSSTDIVYMLENDESLNEKQKDTLKKDQLSMEQVEQACRYMHALDYFADAVDEFRRYGRVYKSVGRFGGLYELSNEDQNIVNRFEAKTGSKVYAAIEHSLGDDECLTLLCVSKYKEDWAYDEDNLKEKLPNAQHYVFAWVENKTCDWCSEYGTVIVQSVGGGLRRTA